MFGPVFVSPAPYHLLHYQDCYPTSPISSPYYCSWDCHKSSRPPRITLQNQPTIQLPVITRIQLLALCISHPIVYIPVTTRIKIFILNLKTDHTIFLSVTDRLRPLALHLTTTTPSIQFSQVVWDRHILPQNHLAVHCTVTTCLGIVAFYL